MILFLQPRKFLPIFPQRNKEKGREREKRER
jgi:hypothetical protein